MTLLEAKMSFYLVVGYTISALFLVVLGVMVWASYVRPYDIHLARRDYKARSLAKANERERIQGALREIKVAAELGNKSCVVLDYTGLQAFLVAQGYIVSGYGRARLEVSGWADEV